MHIIDMRKEKMQDREIGEYPKKIEIYVEGSQEKPYMSKGINAMILLVGYDAMIKEKGA